VRTKSVINVLQLYNFSTNGRKAIKKVQRARARASSPLISSIGCSRKKKKMIFFQIFLLISTLGFPADGFSCMGDAACECYREHANCDGAPTTEDWARRPVTEIRSMSIDMLGSACGEDFMVELFREFDLLKLFFFECASCPTTVPPGLTCCDGEWLCSGKNKI